MKKRIFILIIISLSIIYLRGKISVANSVADLPATPENIEHISKNDNILIFAPHPDDESIGCAGVIQKAINVGAKVRIVYLTNGDSNQLAFIVYEKRLVFRKKEFLHMGEVRRREATAAMKILGLPKENLIFLGYPDFGTMVIFKNYWNTARPFKSLLTRVSSVPYKDNFSYGMPFKAESILTDIKEVVTRIKPNKIFVTSPVDTNGDHRALYLFLKVALLDLGKQFTKNTKVYLYLVHHRNWPKPRHYHPQSQISIPGDMLETDFTWFNVNLNDPEIEKKHKAVLAYKSQTESSAFYLLSFVRRNELFFSVPDIKLSESDGEEMKWSNRFDASIADDDLEEAKISVDKISNSAISFAVKNKKLFVKVSLIKQPIITSFSIYLFGYKKQVAFEQMPKIRIKIIGDTIDVLNGNKKIKAKIASLERENKDIIASIALKDLDNPELVLCSVNINSRSLPPDSNAWRVIDLR